MEDPRTNQQARHHQIFMRTGFQYHSSASPQTASQDLSARNSKTSQTNDNLSQVLPGAHNKRGFSCSSTSKSPQLVPQSLAETSKAHSLKNNLNSPFFTTPSWSFTAPAASIAETETPPKPISSSHESSELGKRNLASASMTPTGSSLPFSRSAVTELTDDDDSADDEDLAAWMARDIEDEIRRSSLVGLGLKAATPRRSSTVVARNLPVTTPFVTLDNFTYNGILLTEKVYVELQDNDFLRIVHILKDTSTSAVTLRGWKFRRTRELNGLIDRKLNEVCWILHVDDDDPRDAKVQGMETVPVYNIVKRRCIRLTNQSFPALSWREDQRKENPETVENDRVLVCRFKYLCLYADAKARAAYEWCEKGFHRLREDESDQRSDNDMKDEGLRRIWRGYTAPGGSQKGWLPGEKEFLRQEEVSHRGLTSRASLKAPSGPDFPIGDPMKRGSVGSLVTADDFQNNSDRATRSTKPAPNDPVHKLSEHRQDKQKPHSLSSGFNDPFTVSNGYEARENDAISTLRRGLRQSSIQPRESRDRSPRIIGIDAHVKTSSSLGTFEKRYEGKLTSRYYPPNMAQRKRSADISLGSPTRPSKRIDRGFRAESSKGDLHNRDDDQNNRTLYSNIRYSHLDSASSDSDRTLGRSQSPDSIEEMCTLLKPQDYQTPISWFPTPVSRRKKPAARRSSDIMLPPLRGGSTGYYQSSMPLTRTARSSVAIKTQASGTTENDDGIIDLTMPQANPYGCISHALPSTYQPSFPSHPSYPRSILSSREESARSTSANSLFKVKPYSTSTETRQEISSKSLYLMPMTPGSSQVNRIPSPPSSSATPGLFSQHTDNSQHQNQSTATKSSASKAHQRRYTFGDCFCGAGGMSRGAVSAGLRINWGFDFYLPPCESYRKNFFGTPIYNVWANQFSEAMGNRKVDICHLSPPCQFFSDAHTIQGKDDDMNTASLFAIFNLLEKAKPRIVTLEQTSGLIRRHPIFFNAVINMFTSRGFSVRWKVMNCADFGLPQRRTRLFVMASW